ncbi:cholesterol 7-desaturase nvd-like [Calliopsis andreniformis]|uniref:cholesterol 7-desaturase nvd-like n=1 Tax=Calliopsis andreniformis TaxID=337506 RepID=UPI003FCE5D07
MHRFGFAQEVAENGADTAHLSAVHGPVLFSKIAYPLSCVARHSWKNNGWVPHKQDKSSDSEDPEKENTEDLSHRAYTTLRHALVLFEKFELLQLDVHVQQIGPGYVELLLQTYLGPIYIFQTVTPMEPLLQKRLLSFEFGATLSIHFIEN